MAEFKFGEIDAVLAALHRIAAHKRVAFTGRLKFLLKNGLPAADPHSGQGVRERPGRGRAGNYSFGDLLQLVTAVELMQAGMDQRLAAELVRHNWMSLRPSAYLSTFEEAEIGRAAISHHFNDGQFRRYIWLAYPEALLELEDDQAKREMDFGDLMAAMPDDHLRDGFTYPACITGMRPKRAIIINATEIIAQIVFLVVFEFKFATLHSIRSDLENDEAAYLEWYGASQPNAAPESSPQATDPQDLAAEIVLRAAEAIPRLKCPRTIELLTWAGEQYSLGNSVQFNTEDHSRLAIEEMIDYGMLFGVMVQSNLSYTLTQFGQAVARLAYRREVDVDQEA